MRLLVTIFTLMATSFTAHADSGSASGSCSGSIHPYGYFYAYTYQYASIHNGQLVVENHNFTFSGIIKDIQSAALVRANSTHVIYRTSGFLVAVPYKAGKGLYIKSLQDPAATQTLSPGELSEWVKLCNY